VRKVVSLVIVSMIAACSDPNLASKVADLEQRVAKMEAGEKPGGGATARPAAPGAAPAAPVNEEEEKAAAELLKAASQAAEQMKYDEAKAKLAELKEKYPNTRPARASVRLDEELAVIGKPAQDLNVEKMVQGQAPSMTSGKPTLVVFWEVWCPHCKREVPKLQETYAKYSPKGLQMVGLTKMTKGATEDQVTEFLKTQNVSYPVAKEAGQASSDYYGVKGIPAAVMVKDGKVVWRGHPARLTDAMLDQFTGS
jgi:thiol-disulfide isomerase/thioredoxin